MHEERMVNVLCEIPWDLWKRLKIISINTDWSMEKVYGLALAYGAAELERSVEINKAPQA